MGENMKQRTENSCLNTKQAILIDRGILNAKFGGTAGYFIHYSLIVKFLVNCVLPVKIWM